MHNYDNDLQVIEVTLVQVVKMEHRDPVESLDQKVLLVLPGLKASRDLLLYSEITSLSMLW